MTAIGSPAVSAGPAKVSDAASLVRHLRPGSRLFLPGSGAEIPDLTGALFASDAPPLAITGSLVPGINTAAFDELPAASTYTSSFAHPSRNRAQQQGRFRHVPVSYHGFARYLARQSFDVGIVQVSPPDAHGRCSFGIAVEFTPFVLQRCDKIFAVVNSRMPRIGNATSFDLSRADMVVETDTALREYDVGAPSDEASLIARSVAGFVEDGATLQIGLGKTPDALMRLLTDRRGLKLHSGMLSDGARALAESGALDPTYEHVSCVHVGTHDYYDWLGGRREFFVRSCDITHAPATLAGLERLVAVNSALSIDLFGQANLEMLDGRTVSGVGGAGDFAHAASLSPDGISIVALPSISGRSRISRIVPSLDGIGSLPRNVVDVVITENGIADLRGASVIERAERLIAVAAPDKRSDLQQAWKEIAARL